jgi:hypothetical protein
MTRDIRKTDDRSIPFDRDEFPERRRLRIED